MAIAPINRSKDVAGKGATQWLFSEILVALKAILVLLQ
jgi:hypothetical protein